MGILQSIFWLLDRNEGSFQLEQVLVLTSQGTFSAFTSTASWDAFNPKIFDVVEVFHGRRCTMKDLHTIEFVSPICVF